MNLINVINRLFFTGRIHRVDSRKMRPLFGRIPVQPVPDRGAVQGNGREGVQHTVRFGWRTEGHLLPAHWHEQGGAAEADRRPLPLQGGRSFPAGRQRLPFLADRARYLPQ